MLKILLFMIYLILQLLASMGNSQPTDCCFNTQQAHQFETIVPSKLIAPKFVQEKLDGLKETLARTSSLAELDYYLSKFKNEDYSKDFLNSICSIRKPNVCLAFQQNSLWNIPIQTKMYNQKQNRFDQDLNRIFALEFGVLKTSGERIEELFQRVGQSNLQKLQALLLEKKFQEFQESQYLQKLQESIKGWTSMQDCMWKLEKQQSYKNNSRHLIYHFQSYVNCMNSETSFCDVVSLSKFRYIYQYFLNRIATTDPELLEQRYSFQNWFYEAESHILYPGQTFLLHNFTPFIPYIDNEGYYQQDTVRFNPPKGDESIPRNTVQFIVTPNKVTNEKVKFRHLEYLYYVPFTIFTIQNIQSKQGRLFVYLTQDHNQAVVKYLKNQISSPKKTTSTMKVKQQLKKIQQQYSKTLESLYGDEFCDLQQTTIMLYKQYIKNKVYNKIEQESVPVLTKHQLQVCQSVAQVKLDEQATLQQMQSQIDQITISKQQLKTLQKDLETYIKKLNFEKLQNQIDSIDVFINIKSLNISQSWLEKIQCLHCFPNLTELFAYSNQIKKIQGLQKNGNLKLLSLARNQIEVLENIGHLTHLRELYLTKNKLELSSAHYLTSIRLSKLKMLTISFSSRADQCFEQLMKRPPAKLKKLLINEGDQLTARTKNTIKRRLKNIQVQYIH